MKEVFLLERHFGEDYVSYQVNDYDEEDLQGTRFLGCFENHAKAVAALEVEKQALLKDNPGAEIFDENLDHPRSGSLVVDTGDDFHIIEYKAYEVK